MSFARALALLAAQCAVVFAVPVGAADVARVSNTAVLSFGDAGHRRSIDSNTVTLDVDRPKGPTALSFRLLPVGFDLSGISCASGPIQIANPARIDAATLAAAPVMNSLDISQPVIFVLDNRTGNRDPEVREEAFVSVDAGSTQQFVRLFETSDDSGVFAGGLPPQSAATAGQPCYLDMKRGEQLRLSFDEDAYSYASVNSILIDPAGIVFDSASGVAVDGAEVTLLDEKGQLATVYGDDGVSLYPTVVTSGATATDASGRVYRFAPGGYRFPLTAPGRYRLRVIPPAGYVAPSTKDRAALSELRDPDGRRFVLNDASVGGIFALTSPEPFIADIPVDRQASAALLLTKTASVREAAPGDFVQYLITIANRGEIAVRDLRLTDTLPIGLRFEAGSTRGGDPPSVAADGRTLVFAVPVIEPAKTLELRYVVSVAPGAPAGEAVNRIVASGTATSNEAAASVRLRPFPFTDGFTVIGRVTAGDCKRPAAGRAGVSGIRLLLEDGTYVVTDRDGLYHFEGVRPGRHVVQLDTGSVPASFAPVACDADTRSAGNAISRFVESDGGLLKRVDFQLRPTGRRAAADAASPIAIVEDAVAAGNRDWFAGQAPGVAMLFPQAGHNPRGSALRVVVKHLPGQRVALTVNGIVTDPLAFDGTDTDADDTVSIARWTGLPLVAGDNRIEAHVLAADGSTVATLTRLVHSARAPADATFVPEHSRLIADGLTRPLIAVRLTDRDGHPVRAGTLVPFRVDQPYAAATDAELEQERQQAQTATTARVVGDEGLAFLALHPTTSAGTVHASIDLAEDRTVRTIDVRAWLSASARDWTIVGFGAGTLGYETLSRRARSLAGRDRGGLVTDGQLALYAKGRIKGSWLATIAYDSDRTRDRDRGLLGTIDPDRFYTVYGDGTRQGYDAPTERRLYVRLERRDLFAMFGDYETGLTATHLGRYSRTLNGARVAFEGRRVTVSAFAAESDERYSRDEIQGNGLSGPYRLGGRDIVPNSDKLRIEVRDRFRSEIIVSSTQMTRHVDYDIDSAFGTIRFREPVLTRDPSLNPVFIVVEYETYGAGRKLIAGGRASVRLAGDLVEVGASVLHDRSVGDGQLAAIDLTTRLSRTTTLRAEAASGGRDGFGSGRAWLIEGEHHGTALDLRGYARQQDIGFGLGQQNTVEAGTRKVGLDARARLSGRLTLTGTAWHQDMLTSAASRDAVDTRLELRRPNGTIFVGAQVAMDRGGDGGTRDSRLLTLGGTQAVLSGKLTLTGQTQIAPGGDKDSVDFPIRHQLTAAYRLTPSVRLLGGYEIANGRDFSARTAQIGFDVAPWEGAKWMSTINRQAAGRPIGPATSGENGQRLFAQYGLSQSLPIGERWSIDATLDASSTVRGAIPEGAVINAFQPVASGGSLNQNGASNGDYAAVTMGANYRASHWSWNGRAEYRDGREGRRLGFVGSALRSLGEGKTLAAGVRWFRVTQDGGAVAASSIADVSLAWRPLDRRWSVLERFSLRQDRADAGITDGNVLGLPAFGGAFQATVRAVNTLAVNWRSGAERSGHGVEATLFHGAKWVRGAFGADDYTGYTDVTGLEVRRDLGSRFDIGVQGSVQHAWSRRAFGFSGGPTLGISPARDLWISAGYNVAGYRDRDFEADRYTRAGPFVTLRLKFDQTGIGRAVAAIRAAH